MEQKIAKIIINFFEDQKINDVKVRLQKPKNHIHGDYTTNVALANARLMNIEPQKLANLLSDYLMTFTDLIKKVDVAGKGFINIWTLENRDETTLEEVLKLKERYGSSQLKNPFKVNVEYVSANPTGLLHLGHARNAAIGNSLVNILEFAGYETTAEYYINDFGNQINILSISVYTRYLELCDQNVTMPEDSYRGQEIITCAQQLKDQYGNKYLNVNYEDVKEEIKDFSLNVMLENIKKDLSNYRVTFDLWTKESSLYKNKNVDQLIKDLKKTNKIYTKDEALWLRTTELGDDKDRVLVKSDKSQTYFLADLAYHLLKINRGCDRLINIWGADHHGYIKRMESGIKFLTDNKCDININIMQMVRLIRGGEEVKMSKRKGTVITLRNLLEFMSVDAARYFMVSRSTNTHLDIDIDIANASDSKNPVYYIQYAHARACSLQKKAKLDNINWNKEFDIDLINSRLEKQIISTIFDFKSLISDIAINNKVHLLANYLQKLAKLFHSYYNEYQIISTNIEETRSRLSLVECCRQTISNGLKLIGVKAPISMFKEQTNV